MNNFIVIAIGLLIATLFLLLIIRYDKHLLKMLSLMVVVTTIGYYYNFTINLYSTLPKVKNGWPYAELIKKNPIFILLFDELSGYIIRNAEGKIISSIYPNLAKLSKKATLYVNSTTNKSVTSETVKQLVSGVSFAEKNLKQHRRNLIAVLQGVMDVTVWERRYKLVSRNFYSIGPHNVLKRVIVFNKALFLALMRETILPDVIDSPDLNLAIMSMAEMNMSYDEYVNMMLSRITDSMHQLVYFYSYLPHHPYTLGMDGRKIAVWPKDAYIFRAFYENRGNLGCQETTNNVARAYINQVRYIDKIVGRFINKLKEKGIFSDAMIIIMSDHGTGFTNYAPGRNNITSNNKPYEINSMLMNAHNLLLIKYPNQENGKIDEFHAKVTDIAPTILGVLGIKPPWKMTGTNLLSPKLPKDREISFYPRKTKQNGPVILPPPFERYIPLIIQNKEITKPNINVIKKIDSKKKAGRLMYIAKDKGIYDHKKNIYTLTGYSEEINGKIPDKVLIVVNGNVSRFVEPCQVIHRKLKKKKMLWIAKIKLGDFRKGTNIIEAYAMTNERNNEYIEYENKIKIDIK